MRESDWIRTRRGPENKGSGPAFAAPDLYPSGGVPGRAPPDQAIDSDRPAGAQKAAGTIKRLRLGDSDQCRSRRRNRGRLTLLSHRRRHAWERCDRRGHPDKDFRGRLKEEQNFGLQLQLGEAALGLLLLAGAGDHSADRAHFTVEGLRHGRSQGQGARIMGHHAPPGKDLQDIPLRPSGNGAEEKHNECSNSRTHLRAQNQFSRPTQAPGAFPLKMQRNTDLSPREIAYKTKSVASTDWIEAKYSACRGASTSSMAKHAGGQPPWSSLPPPVQRRSPARMPPFHRPRPRTTFR